MLIDRAWLVARAPFLLMLSSGGLLVLLILLDLIDGAFSSGGSWTLSVRDSTSFALTYTLNSS